MKTKNILALALSGLVALSSCSEDKFISEPSEHISSEQLTRAAQWNTNVLTGQLAGVTSRMISLAPGSTSHDDFGQKSVDIQVDIISGDMDLLGNSYNWFNDCANLTSYESRRYTSSRMVWNYSYQMIFAANTVLESVGVGDEGVPMGLSNANLNYWGQGKVLRAYGYYQLLTNYGTAPYTSNMSEKKLPIYRDTKSADGGPAQTNEAVYNLIVKDLTEGRQALEQAGVARQFKSDINDEIASTLLAYTYLLGGDYGNALMVAKKVIDENKGGYSLLDESNLYSTGFNNASTHPEFIWAIDITTNNTKHLVTFWSHMDVYTFGYAFLGDRKGINADLQASIPSTDLRAGWFDATSGVPSRKFYSEKVTLAQINAGSATQGADRAWESDVHFLRFAELYLIASEAAARSGDEATAKQYLIALESNRTASANVATVTAQIQALSGTTLLDRIYYNWRVEMWGEGRALLTMKRFQKAVSRSARSLYFAGEAISWNDPRLTLQRPEKEVTNNSNLNK